MLQWMGGSRRKVYTSRKSTQSRQRQYFEQKKQQQQQNQNDVAGGQAPHVKEPRSLDVLNINNLATPSSHRNEPANAEGAITQLDFTLPDASPTEALNDITSLCNSNMNERGSQPRLASSFGHQDSVAAVNSHEQPLGSKISPSVNYTTRKQTQNLGLENEISLIDLASYEGSKTKSTARPAREAHVSLSVKGLGHIKMETPLHSPISIERDLPLPPGAMRLTHKAKRSIPFNVTKALGMYARARLAINPDKIYRVAMTKLNISAAILEVMGAPLTGTDVRAYVMSGGGPNLKFRHGGKRCFLIMPIKGSERKGLVSVGVKKKRDR